MREWGEKLRNVGERSKAGQKLNRKRGISETKHESGQGRGQGSEEDILSWDGIGTPGKRRKKKGRKKKGRKKSLFWAPFSSL